jgi:hypothetical protein
MLKEKMIGSEKVKKDEEHFALLKIKEKFDEACSLSFKDEELFVKLKLNRAFVNLKLG